jgi:hypothetical protein
MILTSAFIATLALFTTPPHDPLPDLTIGTALPAADAMMMDVSGKEFSLKATGWQERSARGLFLQYLSFRGGQRR